MSMGDGVLGDLNVMGVIPARYGSTRLPGKPLLEIYGKPMIYWVARRVSESFLTSYCVATDDPRIADVCEQYDIPHLMTSKNCVNGTERVAEVARQTSADYYVNIQGDEPCINPDAINQIAKSLLSKKNPQFIQAVTPISRSEDILDVSVVKVAVSESSHAIYFSRSPIPYPRNQEDNVYYRCLGLYLYGRNFLSCYSTLPASRLEQIEQIEQLRVLEHHIRIDAVVVQDDGFSVDTPEDLAFARSLDRAMYR